MKRRDGLELEMYILDIAAVKPISENDARCKIDTSYMVIREHMHNLSRHKLLQRRTDGKYVTTPRGSQAFEAWKTFEKIYSGGLDKGAADHPDQFSFMPAYRIVHNGHIG